MTVSSQVILSEVPKEIILLGITGITNCSPEFTHTRKVLSQKEQICISKWQPPQEQKKVEFSQLFF